MAQGFKDALKKQRENKATTQELKKATTSARDLELPQKNLNQKELQISRQETPAGQIIRVPIHDVYAVEQIRPEEDFESETIEGIRQTFDEVGILTPPRCFPRDKRGYRLWMGETRWRSAKAKGETFIDIYVGTPPKNDKVRILGQMIENLHQSGIKPLATAKGIKELRDVHGMTQEAIAMALGKPKAFVSKHMRLIDAPSIISSLLKNKITKDVDLIYTMCQVNDINPDSVEKLAKMARDGKLTRQVAIKELNFLKGKPTKEKQPLASMVMPEKIKTDVIFCNSGQNSTKKEEAKTSLFVNTDSQTARSVENIRKTQMGNKKHPETETGIHASLTTKESLVLVTFKESEGFLLTDRIPEEFGKVWVEMSIGTMCINAADISILGIKKI